MAKYSEEIGRLKHEFSFTFLQIYRQLVENLKGQTDDSCRLYGEYYNETRQIPLHREAMDKTTLSSVYLIKLYLNYLFSNYTIASDCADQSEKYLDGMTGTVHVPLFYFYDSLTRLALHPDFEASGQSKILKRVASNQKKMKLWAKHAPMNHQHKYDLVEAERLAVQGSEQQAEKYYHQAVKLAKKHGYRNEEALILERTALFYEKAGRRQQAGDTMMKARSAYERWGAMAKVRAIDKSFSFLLVGRSVDARAEKEVTAKDVVIQEPRMSKDLDIATIMKATRTISSEVVLENLLHQLVRIIIENAGAQKGALVLNKEGGLRIEASASVESKVIEARQSLPIEQSDDLSVDIIRYVERTQEALVVNDAVDSNQFFADPYVVKNKPKSILCMPIVQKKITTGVLYLENNLATDVFTQGRIEILNIILGQAAISLDNAQLYENLKKEVAVRKQAEERVLHLATAMEQAAEAILIIKLDGTITYANPACETIFGYEQEEIRGENTRVLLSDNQAAQTLETIENTLLAGEIWRGKMPSKKKDGGICKLEVTVSPIKDDQNQIVNFVSVSRDITQEIRMERELRQAHKMEAIGTLAGGIAHDFNNILAAIMGYTELATFQAPEESPVQVNLERVIVSTKRAKDLVRQILTFSRQTDQEIQPVQMKIIIKEALRMLRATLPSTIEFQPEIIAKSDYIFADPTQIHQIMMNLCTNAAHSMESGGLLTVRLEEYLVNAENHDYFPELTPGPYISLTIKDTGHGIDKEIIERIFEPFFTTKEPGKGTGMGLAMIHGVVASCEGAIRVNSEIDKGTKFQVLLPKYEGDAAEEEDSTPEKIIPGKERILFVDDEITLVTLAEEGLKRMGYQVHLETDSIRALEKFKQNPKQFDLIITDLTMPKMTGIELSKATIKIRPDIPIILYSGMLGGISPTEIEEIGIRGFLSKPLLLKQLSRAIRDVLDKPGEIFVR